MTAFEFFNCIFVIPVVFYAYTLAISFVVSHEYVRSLACGFTAMCVCHPVRGSQIYIYIYVYIYLQSLSNKAQTSPTGTRSFSSGELPYTCPLVAYCILQFASPVDCVSGLAYLTVFFKVGDWVG